MAFNWTCPYCGRATTINDNNFKTSEQELFIQNSEGHRFLKTQWIVCPNEECKRINLVVILYNAQWDSGRLNWSRAEEITRWNLLPSSSAKVFPDYIPKALRDDYEEAAKIIDLSPKASATLSRRCLQGIIRDFWGVTKARLIDEIAAIEDKVDPLTWKSIDSVRKVGNIGAHLEKDINLIIDLEPKEAGLLLHLIELLFEEWYIQRHERELKLKAIISLADSKDNQKKK